jgi:hypothetical protein
MSYLYKQIKTYLILFIRYYQQFQQPLSVHFFNQVKMTAENIKISYFLSEKHDLTPIYFFFFVYFCLEKTQNL